jgi:hypothetical protein
MISQGVLFYAVTADLRAILSFAAIQIPRLDSVAFKAMQQTPSSLTLLLLLEQLQ